MYTSQYTLTQFLSTLPAWGATTIQPIPNRPNVFLSTLPAWGATKRIVIPDAGISISIHAPRVGSDLLGIPNGAPTAYISIHAPRVGSDTRCRQPTRTLKVNFYPRSPRGERRAADAHEAAGAGISIHAPRVGSDPRMAEHS